MSGPLFCDRHESNTFGLSLTILRQTPDLIPPAILEFAEIVDNKGHTGKGYKWSRKVRPPGKTSQVILGDSSPGAAPFKLEDKTRTWREKAKTPTTAVSTVVEPFELIRLNNTKEDQGK